MDNHSQWLPRARLLASKIMGWAPQPGSPLADTYWDDEAQCSRLLTTDNWQPWRDIAEAWRVHRRMCARDPEVKARYLHALANLMLDRYGPPSIWTAPLEVLEPADICYAALLALAPDDAEVKEALALSDAALLAQMTLPDGTTPVAALEQQYPSPFPKQQVSGDIRSPDYVRLYFQVPIVGQPEQTTAGTLYLNEAGARLLLGQLRLWLGQRARMTVTEAEHKLFVTLDAPATQALREVLALLPPLPEFADTDRSMNQAVLIGLTALVRERAGNRTARAMLLQLPLQLALAEHGDGRALALLDAVESLPVSAEPVTAGQSGEQ